MRRPNLKLLAVSLFAVIAAVAAALGCPVFRNPGSLVAAGGVAAYLRHLVDAHRRS